MTARTRTPRRCTGSRSACDRSWSASPGDRSVRRAERPQDAGASTARRAEAALGRRSPDAWLASRARAAQRARRRMPPGQHAADREQHLRVTDAAELRAGAGIRCPGVVDLEVEGGWGPRDRVALEQERRDVERVVDVDASPASRGPSRRPAARPRAVRSAVPMIAHAPHRGSRACHCQRNAVHVEVDAAGAPWRRPIRERRGPSGRTGPARSRAGSPSRGPRRGRCRASAPAQPVVAAAVPRRMRDHVASTPHDRTDHDPRAEEHRVQARRCPRPWLDRRGRQAAGDEQRHGKPSTAAASGRFRRQPGTRVA